MGSAGTVSYAKLSCVQEEEEEGSDDDTAAGRLGSSDAVALTTAVNADDNPENTAAIRASARPSMAALTTLPAGKTENKTKSAAAPSPAEASAPTIADSPDMTIPTSTMVTTTGKPSYSYHIIWLMLIHACSVVLV